MSGYLQERQANSKMGRPTGQIDTLLKYEFGNAEYELKNLTKLAFIYERHPDEFQEIAS